MGIPLFHYMDNQLESKIRNLEKRTAHLEPPDGDMERWVGEAWQYAGRFIGQIRMRKSYEAHHRPKENWTDFSEPTAFKDILQDIEEHIDSSGINPASGGHLGYIPGGGIFPSALGDFLAAVTNRYAGIYFANPGAVELENALLDWLRKLFNFPSSCLGNLTSGGSIANLIAITTARDKHDIRNASRHTIYLTAQAHHSNIKALRIAGLGHCQMRIVPMDARFRMDASRLREMIEEDRAAGLQPFLLISAIGSTDTGAIDPVRELGEICRKEGLWYHIDAAYGGFFILVDSLRHHFSGIELADSLVVDPHKGLFLPYGSGAVLIREGKYLRQAHGYEANYMQDAHENPRHTSPATLSPELTKHFRGLRMLLPLKLFGIAPFKSALEEKFLLCQYFYEEIGKRGFERGPQPELSVAIYRFIPPKGDVNNFNKRLIAEIHRDGRIFISSTMIDGAFWLRIAVLCFRTHKYHIDLLLELLESARDKCLSEID